MISADSLFSPWLYFAKLKRVIDGDTIVMDVDLGGRISVEWTLRLYGINAPELIGPTAKAGADSKEHLQWLIDTFGVHHIETLKDKKDRYGRYLVRIWGFSADGLVFEVNKTMVTDGHAVEKTY